MRQFHIIVLAGLLLTACADFERGEKPEPDVPEPQPDVVADVGGDLGGPDVSQDVPEEDVAPTISFAETIAPIIDSECGACHSFGYDDALDLIDADDPAASDLLQKGAGETSHGGGAIFEVDGEDWNAIVEWIEAGAAE
ncbi:MAG: hypothetical protein ACQEXJ_06625 [Myxococcota bacterium]